MAFVNEFVPQEDVKKYGLEQIDRKYRRAHFRPEWTIDREREIYLREVDGGGRDEECTGRCGFTFYWKGALLFVRLTRRGGGVRGGEGWTEWSLHDDSWLGPSITGLAKEELLIKLPEIITDLKAALAAYKDFGARSSTVVHSATFTF